MASNAAIDYTKYDIKKGLLKLSLPAMGSSLFGAVYDMANIFWIGMLGANAVAGVTIAMQLYWFGSMFNDLFGTPSVILLSRRYAEKDQEGMQKVFSQTLLVKLTFAILFVLLSFPLQKFLLQLLNCKGEAMEQAMLYFSTRIWFMPIAFTSYTINTAFRTSGDVNRFAVLQLAAAIFNIVCDPILILVLKMGVQGAAITSGIAETIVLLTGLYWLGNGKARIKLSLFASYKPDWKLLWTMLKLGIPTTIDSCSNNIIGLFAMRILNTYGVIAVAAWGIISRLRTILFLISFSLEMAVTTLVGQNMGAGFKERAKEAAFTGIRMDMILVGIYGIFNVLFAPWIVQFFSHDPEIIRMGTVFIRILAISDLFFAGYMACLGAIAGAGETRINMIISLIGNWLVLLPALAIITYVLKLSIIWLPCAYILTNIALFGMGFKVISGERWLARKL